MRAMSLGLIKGTIDEVDKTVNVTWVQPRVLDRTEVATISQQLGDWVERYACTLNYLCVKYVNASMSLL